MHLVGISGSLRTSSYNTGLLHTAAELLDPEHTFEIIDIRDFPMFNADLEHEALPTAVVEATSRIAAADGILIATPEYNHSYTGVLKNALDWLSRGPIRPLSDKPVAVVGASTGNFGAVRAQAALRYLLHTMNMHVLPKPELLVTNAASKFNEQHLLVDENTLKIYRTLLSNFVAYIDRLTITTVA